MAYKAKATVHHWGKARQPVIPQPQSRAEKHTQPRCLCAHPGPAVFTGFRITGPPPFSRVTIPPPFSWITVPPPFRVGLPTLHYGSMSQRCALRPNRCR